MSDRPQLAIDFIGEEYVVEQDRPLTFGRSGDLVIDDNQHLHRRLGQFSFADGMWWLHNIGSALTIEVIDRNSPSRLTVVPGATVALVFEEAAIRFHAGSTNYELTIDVPIARPSVIAPGPDSEEDGAATVTGRELTFTPDQLRCIIALAEPRLVDPSRMDLPTNKAAAARLGWKITKFNRKLDNVCNKVDAAGVQGLRGGTDSLATKRRERLVDFAVASAIVSPADLPMLDS